MDSLPDSGDRPPGPGRRTNPLFVYLSLLVVPNYDVSVAGDLYFTPVVLERDLWTAGMSRPEKGVEGVRVDYGIKRVE